MVDEESSNTLRIPAWAHDCGYIQLGSAVSPKVPDAGIDRVLVAERIARYCWAYDERQADLLGDCFTSDAVWEGSVLGQIAIGPFTGRDRIVKWLTEFWPHQHDQRRHMILNTIVDAQDASDAVTLSYLLLMASTGSVATIEATGFYRTAYRREDGVWRIARLTAGFDKPFWPGNIDRMSPKGRSRHGVGPEA